MREMSWHQMKLIRASAQILPKYVAEFNQKEKVTVTNGNRERNQKKTSQIIQQLNSYGLAMRIRTTSASIHIENFRSKKKKNSP